MTTIDTLSQPRTTPWATFVARARPLIATEATTDLFIARWLTALVLFPHGAQKVFGLFGGYGWTATYGALTSSYGLPGPIAIAVMLLELIAPIALALGLFTRGAALTIAGLMVGAATYHFEHGFFMNWFGQQAGEGYQFHVAYIAALIPLIARGGGRWSVDRSL